jgi:alpha-L-fucosidase
VISSDTSRRKYLAAMAATAVASAAGLGCKKETTKPQPDTQLAAQAPPPGHERRIQWWREAKFGTFVCLGLYSLLGRHEWAMEEEGIPLSEYELLARQFNPKPGAPREWAKLARRAGMKYIVFLTKHHEGYCLFDSKLTNYCTTKTRPGRDLVAEYVEATRAEGLRVGLYYSLMDWHHPDGARCAVDEAARTRFVDYIHGHIREILTNYGKIDILWYDVAWPLDAKGWESEEMNKMVFELQPDIIVNNRNLLPGDFSTPEQEIVPAKGEHDWETCMTMNESWGYQAADDNWKTPKTSLRNLITCARDGGNFLYNLGPRADGSIPEESVRVLNAIGAWMDKNGGTIYGAERCEVRNSLFANFTRKGHTLYIHVHFWPGETVSIGGLRTRVKSAKLLASGKPVNFKQDQFRVQFTELPASPPDHLITVIAAECESEPVQDMLNIRKNRPRGQV